MKGECDSSTGSHQICRLITKITARRIICWLQHYSSDAARDASVGSCDTRDSSFEREGGEREIILLRSIVHMMIHVQIKNYNEGLCGLIQGDLR